MKKHKVAIIIVNWDGEKYLKNCLDSVFRQTYKNYEVILVDNGSKDGSQNFIKKKYPKVRLIELNYNSGFAKGNNIGIKEAFKDESVEYIVCLNNDTIVDKKWLKYLVKTVNKHKDAGMIASKAFFKDGKTIQNCGLSLEKGVKNIYIGGISLGFGKREFEVPQYDKELQIFAPGGVASLYKRKMLEQIGLFDEDYFAYCEDLDLGFRGQLKGWKCYLSPKSKLIHLRSQTGGVASNFKVYMMEKNVCFTAIKNFPVGFLIKFPYYNFKVKLALLNSSNISVKKFKQKNSTLSFIALFVKTYFSILVNLPRMLIKRFKIQKNKKVTNEEIEKWFTKFNRGNLEYES